MVKPIQSWIINQKDTFRFPARLSWSLIGIGACNRAPSGGQRRGVAIVLLAFVAICTMSPTSSAATREGHEVDGSTLLASSAGSEFNCLRFDDSKELQLRVRYWVARLARMPVASVFDWVTGMGRPPPGARVEASAQKDCLVQALRESIGEEHGARLETISGWRSFSRQAAIWRRKFQFRAPGFDRISEHARRTCEIWIRPAELRWNPRNPRHRGCWLAPEVESEAALSSEQRQREILQVTSAPGISRHHWGTDFDLFDPSLSASTWLSDRFLLSAYRWMSEHGIKFGFFQPYGTRTMRGDRGYLEERWHWSYYPVAHALSAFIRAHGEAFEKRLFALWGTADEYSYPRRHWRDFVFEINPPLGLFF